MANLGRHFVHILAIISIAIGCLVMLGWWLKIPSLIQILPDLVPMQFNTALASFLAGISVLFITSSRAALVAKVSSLLGFILSGLTFIQYPFGWNIGLDDLFVDPFITVLSPDPGRMALNTSLGFLTFFSSVLAVALGFYHGRKQALITMLAAVAMALAMTSLFGYLTRLTTAIGWAGLSQMAPHTLVAIGTASIALLIHQKHIAGPQRHQQMWLSAVMAGAILTLLSSLFYAINAERRNIERQFESYVAKDRVLTERRVLHHLSNGLMSISKDLYYATENLQRVAAVAEQSMLLLPVKAFIEVPATGGPKSLWSEDVVLPLDFLPKDWPSVDDGELAIALYQRLNRRLILARTQWRAAESGVVKYLFVVLDGNEYLQSAYPQLELNLIQDSWHEVSLERFSVQLNFAVQMAAFNKDSGVTPLSTAMIGLFVMLFVLAFLFMHRLIVAGRQEQQISDMEMLKLGTFNAMLDGLVVIDQKGIVLDLNQAAANLFDYSSSDLLGGNINQLMPEPYFSNHDHYLQRYQDGGQRNVIGKQRLLEGKRRNGQTFPMLLQVSEGERGGAPVYIGVIHDMTDFYSMQSEAEKRTALMDAALKVSTSGFVICDERGQIVEFNKTAQALFGEQGSDITDKSILAYFKGESLNALRDVLHDQLKAPVQSSLELLIEKRDGSSLWVILNVGYLREQQLFLIHIVDVSDIKALNEALEGNNQKLQALNSDLEKFAYVASHDLKAPLRGIRQTSEWIVEDLGTVPDEVQENIDLMTGRIRRMENLLADLLNYYRAGREAPTTQLVEVDEWVSGIFALFSVPESFRCIINSAIKSLMINRVAVEQILRNLIDNAIKHRRSDSGFVQVSITELADQYVFTVEDNGPGIAGQYVEQVFDLFQTLKPRDEVEGSGMGLAVVRKIAEKYGGSITLVTLEDLIAAGEREIRCRFILKWPKPQGENSGGSI